MGYATIVTSPRKNVASGGVADQVAGNGEPLPRGPVALLQKMRGATASPPLLAGPSAGSVLVPAATAVRPLCPGG